ncbi:hypothetical protein OJF2_65130 [Aquisphaera giovannonii]|uniref:Biopolymer transport protein ExbD/TolR n=1 Tax=Aquisphaera giovannonii TaxID=406548 RepID=A0A5B9WB71_9BACT|nr:biopolymer transporter ExbD [Aquisphaera giovannonii]QEH37918.1 hypothetical protein OJF2_65130 [Aquisphaera giovannonii]
MSSPGRAACLALLAATAALPWRAALADDFDRLDGEVLGKLLRDPKTKSPASLGFRELEALPTALRGVSSPLIVLKTDQGNYARLLVAPGFHKRKDPPGALVPVLVIERFDTFDGGQAGTRVAKGKDVTLFPGFRVDLDTGRIVPEGLGGDLRFAAKGENDGLLAAIEPARLATLDARPPLPAEKASGPSAGKVVRASDYAGKYRLVADNQWSGELSLQVDPAGAVSGWFVSDGTGGEYPVSGRVEAEGPPKLSFSVQFPRARQDFAGRLWSEGKGVIAGLFTMGSHESSFVAVRDGVRNAADLDLDVAPGLPIQGVSPRADAGGKPWIRVALGSQPDRYRVRKDADEKTAAELIDVLKEAAAADPGARVVLAAPASAPYSRVLAAVDAIRGAGIGTIRVVPAAGEP